jgi:hypothetical protein
VSGHLVHGELRPRDPQQTRLFFGPTAKSLEHGDAYAGLYYFHVPFVQVGVTDRFSIGGGSPILVSLLTGEFGIWITPKLQVVSGDRVQMAIGSISTIGDGPDVGLLYGVSRIGGSDRSASIGLGYGYHGANGLVVMAGAEARTSRRVKWMTENWFTPTAKVYLVAASDCSGSGSRLTWGSCSWWIEMSPTWPSYRCRSSAWRGTSKFLCDLRA